MSERVPAMVSHRGVAGYKGPGITTFDPTAQPEDQVAGPAWQSTDYVPPSGSSPTAASQAEMEAGVQTALRSMSPLRVAQAIAALGTRRFTFGLDAVDLIAGDVDLNEVIQAVAGDIVTIVVSPEGYVAHDAEYNLIISPVDNGPSRAILKWNSASNFASTATLVFPAPFVSDGGPILFLPDNVGADPTVGHIQLLALVESVPRFS